MIISASIYRSTATSRWLSLLALALLVSGAAPVPKDSADPGQSMQIKPIVEVVEQMRQLSANLENMAFGTASQSVYSSSLEDVMGRLRRADPVVWRDARSRMSLIKLTLSGGDPALLRKVSELNAFPEDEQTLLHGVLAFAEGERRAAQNYLGLVDFATLPPSLAGHVALVLGGVTADTDAEKARELFNKARLLSPGTLVEETALRLTIGLWIATANRQSFKQAFRRYLARFPSSIYLPVLVREAAAFISREEIGRSPEEAEWLAHVTKPMAKSDKLALSVEMAKSAVMRGKLDLAVFATRLARSVPDLAEADQARIDALEGAALILASESVRAVELLNIASKGRPGEDYEALIVVARATRAAIKAPLAEHPGGEGEIGSQPDDPDTKDFSGSRISLKATQVRVHDALRAVEKVLDGAKY